MDKGNFPSRPACEESLLTESSNLIREHEKNIFLQRLKEEKDMSINFSSGLRSGSQISTDSSNKDICRICHCESEDGIPLIAPCYCSGSLRYVHQACLQQWIKSSDTKSCELCKFSFIMHTKTKPFNKWEKLEMSSIERRKLFCSVTFHAVAITCVIWSLYVLIDRTAEEVQAGMLEWPFWTKLIVVAIGFTGGIVFMYVQCKMYAHLCRRWQAYNRVIYVQNAPEKMPLPKCDFIKVESLRGSVDSGTDVGQGSLASGGDKDPTESSHLMSECNLSQKNILKSKMDGGTARTFLERLTMSGKNADMKDELNKSRISDGKLPLVINVQSLDMKSPKFGVVEMCSVFDDIGSSGESSQDVSQKDKKENNDNSLSNPYCGNSYAGSLNQSLTSLDNLNFHPQSS